MASLFSYVVDHDIGFAPNPYGGFCTLVHCKFGGTDGRPNIVELAEEQDWVLGSGGQSKKSAGNGRIIYLMRVDEKLPFREYLRDPRFKGRTDCIDHGAGNQFALVSCTYYYFGKNALPLSDLPSSVAPATVLKRGPGFRRDLPEAKLEKLTAWFSRTYKIGMHGDPCGDDSETRQRRKRRICKFS
jgi:hypothetical protein